MSSSPLAPPEHVVFLHKDTFDYLHSKEYRNGYKWIYSRDKDSTLKNMERRESVQDSERDFLDECLVKIPSILTLRKNLHLQHMAMMQEHQSTDSNPEGFRQHHWLPECLYKNVSKNEVMFEHWNRKLRRYYVVIDDKCAESVMRGSDIFAVGVIATNIPKLHYEINDEVSVIMMRLREGVTLPHGEESYGLDVAKKVIRGRFMPDTYQDLLRIYSQYYHIHFIANGVTNIERREIFRAELQHDVPAVSITESLYNGVERLNIYNNTKYFPQNMASMLAARALNVAPNHRILEACCAPGGKLTHISHLMNNGGEIVAFERSRKRTNTVESLLKLQNISNVKIFVKDFTQSIKKKLVEPASFDRILCDLPCTGLGNMNLFYPFSMGQVTQQSEYQHKLLDIALKLLKVDGELVFSTCSLFPQENEMNVAQLLEQYSGKLQLVDLHEEMEKLFGADNWIYNKSKPAWGHSEILKNNFNKRVIRFDPCLHEESIGFFMARFRKTAEF
eukprot:CAMPEP_0117445392 /NCGR_PEP_ID=MMETSP0759-20121206/5770_1 /TAXON_ID=63605 /ORGANISM="Percolomonas cosmopolitus, Strain WS" /LENGTH=503 /DNA_ID=CAMNT_0005237563 /DNA_START=44 /DNA_END=1555 /DNA_ORIENTATION=-